MTEHGGSASAWAHALGAAALFAVDPLMNGVALRASPGPARDAWLAALRALLPAEMQMRRAPSQIGDDRWLGGVDIAASLRAGRPVAEQGLLAQCDGGVVVLAMAERLPSSAAAHFSRALDFGRIQAERDGMSLRHRARLGVIALDEGRGEDEAPPAALLDRLAFRVDLASIDHRALARPRIPEPDIAAARARLREISADAAAIRALVVAAAQLGVASLRAPLLALRVARAACALRGDCRISEEDLAVAARYVLAPRATTLPESEAQPQQQEPSPEKEEAGERQEADQDKQAPSQLEDMVLEAAQAAIPPDLLAALSADRLRGARAESSGKAGAGKSSTRRGRPIGARSGSLRHGRLALVDTLRAAAPWQAIRRAAAGARRDGVLVTPEDFRIMRFRDRRETTAIFVIDASGSAAMHRLAEAKGAVELLLGDCYARRDNVALVAFRGKSAEIVLPPTRSLACAKRRLRSLPGGGGTPLASGLEAALALAQGSRRRGQTPLVVLMSDGRANIGRSGEAGRARALEDALQVGRQLRALGIAALAIDTSPPLLSARSEAPTLHLAQAMNARYLKLPRADAETISHAVRAVARDG